MSDAPAFSVIIPTYNCAAYIAGAVGSVLGQTMHPSLYEVIVVDDGSTDGTQRAVEAFEGRITYIRKENHGAASARNVGIAHASGRIAAFLDADDYWLPGRLESIQRLFDIRQDCFVTTDYYVERCGERSEKPYYLSRGLLGLFELRAALQLEFAVEDNFINGMTVVPLRMIAQVGGFDETLKYGEDWELWLRLLDAGFPVRIVHHASAVYRFQRPGSTTTRHDYEMAQNRVTILERYPAFASPRRLQNATASMHRIGLKRAIRAASLRGALRHGMALAAGGNVRAL
ncbi:MAG TPA: glycosyltransferase family 2 protein [Candidatus Baltobacteraceae bacterium]|jgi:glycosyltransferase involved in cell wall biosynthesis